MQYGRDRLCPQGDTSSQCSALGANWQLASQFGQPTSGSSTQPSFQIPRQYLITFGARPYIAVAVPYDWPGQFAREAVFDRITPGAAAGGNSRYRSEEHTSELQSLRHL